ncbi:MFS transporter [Akkermansiaceae bacterium]|nr:MFS transporter [Akkermansiaceae bacterium]
MQSTNAFNDSFTKFILIPLGMGLASMGLAPSRVEHLFALLAILPFILFAPMAGWLGDRFPKSLIIRLSSWFQLLVLILMGGGLWLGSRQEAASWPLYIVMLAFFLLAMQSALLSPSKMGVVKELVGSERLGFANGVMEGSVILMILLGQIIGGYWYDAWGLQNGRAPWAAAMIPVLWILIGAALSICFSHLAD